MSKIIQDVLSWDKFSEETKKEKIYPPKEIDLFNRLIVSTKKFFCNRCYWSICTRVCYDSNKKINPLFGLN